MATYVPNAADATQPTGDKPVESAALEFRTLKVALAAVTSVAGALADIATVAADLNEPVSEIETVATSIANVDAVGANIANVNTVAVSIANVNAVAADLVDINTVAADGADIGTVSTNIASVNIVAANIGSISAAVAALSISPFGATLIDDADAAAARATLGTDIYKTVPVGVSFNTGECYKITAGFTLAIGFASGNVYTIYNNSAAAVTLTQGAGLTLRLAGTATTGNRTLAAYGLATVLCMSTTEYVISGAGIS